MKCQRDRAGLLFHAASVEGNPLDHPARPRPAPQSAAARTPRAARRARRRRRRSGRTCRARRRRGAHRPSAASRPELRARRGPAGTAQTPRRRAGSPPAPTPARCPGRAPTERRREPAGADLHGLVAEQLTGRRGDRPDRVRALVHVRTEHDHGLRPLSPRLRADDPADMACVRAVPRSYQVTPGHPRPATSDTAKGSQTKQPTA
jgi:hypothetical protein